MRTKPGLRKHAFLICIFTLIVSFNSTAAKRKNLLGYNYREVKEFTEATLAINPKLEYTTVSFEMKESGNVDVLLFDQKGRKVADIFSGILDAGIHSVNISNRSLPSGTYVCKIVMNNKTEFINVVRLGLPK